MNMTLRFGRLGRLGRGPGDFEHHRHARGVVVGAGIEHAAADAQMVVVGRQDDPLVAERRVGPDEAGADVRGPESSPRLACRGSAACTSRRRAVRARAARNCSIEIGSAVLPAPSPRRPPYAGEARSGDLGPQPSPRRQSRGRAAVAGRLRLQRGDAAEKRPAATVTRARSEAKTNDPSRHRRYRRPAPSSLSLYRVATRRMVPIEPAVRAEKKSGERLAPRPIAWHVT